MDNELLYPCSYSSLYLSIVLSFKAKSVSQFSPELCKLESLNMVYICRLSDCIVGLRLMVIAFIFLFFVHFFSFPKLHGNIKIFMLEFSQEFFKARMLKLGIHMENELLHCGIEKQTPCSYSSLYLFFFCLLMLNLCRSFLRNCAS